MSMVFRIDDVSANTDFRSLGKMIGVLKSRFPCEVWLCVNPFSFNAPEGSVYPQPPFKDETKDFFYTVNKYLDGARLFLGQDKVVSHGLFHADHRRLQYDAQEMSIVGSCRILRANTFVPPFNRYNEATESVCRHYGINLVRSELDGWRSLEHEVFDASHYLWYFHPWRFTVESFRETLEGRYVPAKSV